MRKLFLIVLCLWSSIAFGSATVSRLYDFTDDSAGGIPISSSKMDAEFDQLIAALNQKLIIKSSAPSSPVAGMFWYDSTNKLLKEYRNNEWVIHGSVHVGTSAPVTQQTGDLWYDSTNKLLKGYNGTSNIVLGPTDLSAPSMGIGTVTPVTGKFTTIFTTGNVGIGTITAAGGALMVQGGNVGIGTVNTPQKLTVAGLVYSTSGGVQFPDNTTQATKALNTSNVIYSFSGVDGGTAAAGDPTNGTYGVLHGAATIAANGRVCNTSNSANSPILLFEPIKWVKIAGVNTLTVYARVNSNTATCFLRLDVNSGGLTANKSLTGGSVYTNETAFTLDVSTLTTGTAYPIAIYGYDSTAAQSIIKVTSLTILGS